MGDRPLHGLTCVELSERGGAAYAGKLLRRLGADVTKVEPPEGDLLRRQGSRRHEADGKTTTPAFDFFNDGKTTRICRGAAELHGLVADADAFILDIEPRRYEAWGLNPESLDGLGARIVCAITPFGFTGPYAGYRGPELVTSAFGGMNVGIGEPGRPPLNMPFMQTAVQAGLTAAIAVIGDLVEVRDRGETTVVEISETDVWATIHAGTTMVSFLFSNRLRKREGRRVLGQPYPHSLFRCKDGWIALQASERHQYDQLIEMVGSPQWAIDPQVRQPDADEQRACRRNRCPPRELDPQPHSPGDFRRVSTTQDPGRAGAQRVRGADRSRSGVPPGFRDIHRGNGRRRNRAGATVPVPSREPRSPRSGATPPGTRPIVLEGTRVLDFGWVWAGAVPGQMLAFLGAEVIKVETRKRLDYMRAGASDRRDGARPRAAAHVPQCQSRQAQPERRLHLRARS